MHILELDSYNLSDTVKFHDRLNPRLWDSAEHLQPEVADKLMEIARDFQEFLGVPDLDVVDITISGSNAAYNYTDSSDIDLHLVINIPKVKHDEVYRELFNAKKYEYNDIHNIRIGGADVELYAQDSEQPHHSQGIYSLLNKDWISVPKRRRSTIDDVSTRSKYEDLAARVDSTIKSQDLDRMINLMSKIKTMRQTGLEQQGEFGADNLAFKLLRNNGYIKRLIDARNAARDAELSLAELARPRQTVTYGFTTESPDGVNPTTKMFLENEPSDQETTVQEFIDHVINRLGIDPAPEIVLHSDPAWSKQNQSFGRYNADAHTLEVNLSDRHIMDILRTVAHELVHCRQNQQKPLPDYAGKTGSAWENDANARAGVIMRDYAESNPEKFTESASGYIPKNKKEARDPRFSMALTKDIKPGQVGKEANKLALKTNAQGQPGLLMKTVNLREGSVPKDYQDLNNPPGPEFKPTMPAGTVKVDVSDVYDWYKLGQHISNLEGLGKHDFGAGPPSAILSFGDEDLEHQYIQALKRTGLDTTDIDPVDPNQPPGMPRQKTDPTYNVGENFADGKNPQDKGDSKRHGINTKASVSSLRKTAKQGGRKGQLAHWLANMKSGRAKTKESVTESEQLLEINMSPSSLRTLAAQTGAIAGMEFEMIVPGVDAGDDDDEDQEREPDYEADEPAYDIESIVNFFYDDDYNGRREIERLRGRMESEYQDWQSESVGDSWTREGKSILQDYIENNEFDREEEMLDASEVIKQANPDLDPESSEFFDLASARVAEKLDALTEEAWEAMDRTYDIAFEEYTDEMRDDFSENDWLESEGIHYMSDVERQYEIMWPHWTSALDSDIFGGAGIESVADDFSSAIGREVNWSATYHDAKREAGKYVVEPDGSLIPGDEDDAGLEFVSPPLPIDDMLSDLNKVKAWADGRGCYTSKAAKTGLHINVSVPNFDAKKLDYVKLALLLGDQYVLEQFGRTGNTYAKSALDIVKTRVQERPGDAAQLLNKMRDNLEALATKVIHTGETSKFTSINTKTGYVEFRSPGGDWLDENFSKIENTLLRFVVALDAAMDPEKYRQEYLTKLYKILHPSGQKDVYGDMIQEFSRYMAHMEQRSTDAPGKLSPEAQQAIKEFRRAAAAELTQTTAAPAGAAANYKIYSILDGRIMDTFYAANQASAEDQFRDWLMSPEAGASDNFRYAPMGTIIRGAASAPAATTPATTTNTLTPTGPGPWEIYRISDNSSVREIGHTNRSAAETEARSALGLRGEAPELYGVRTRASQSADATRNGIIDIEPDIEQYAVPGSTLDLQRQRQQAAGSGTWTGQWIVKNEDTDQELYRFGGIGNSQSDANRVALEWIRSNAPYTDLVQIVVVPEMEP